MKLSVLIAVRNEEHHLPALLTDLDAQEDPRCDVEVLIADGKSNDATPELAQSWSESTRHDARVLVNEKQRQYLGVNFLIARATGDIVVKLDGHSRLSGDFLRRVVDAQRNARAEIVGGRMSCVGLSGALGNAIGAAQLARFGTGGAAFRVGDKARFVDAVPFPCVRREVFERIGMFRGELSRNADTEFFARARRAGISIWFDPAIRSTYFVRPTVWGISKQQFRNGYWFPALLNAAQVRHLVPLGFVLGLIALPLFGWLVHPAGFWALFVTLALYGLIIVGTAVTANRDGLSLAEGLLIAIVIPVMHISYGLGWLCGFLSPAIWRAAFRSMGPAPQLSKEDNDS